MMLPEFGSFVTDFVQKRKQVTSRRLWRPGLQNQLLYCLIIQFVDRAMSSKNCLLIDLLAMRFGEF